MYPQSTIIHASPPRDRWRSRIQKLIVVMHAVVLVVCVTSKATPHSSFVYLIGGVGASCFATWIAFSYSKVPTIQYLSLFLAANFTGKLAYTINFPEQTRLAVLGKEHHELATIIYEKYFSFGIAFVAFSLAALFSWAIVTTAISQAPALQSSRSKLSGFVRLAIVCYGLLALRVFLFHVLKIGVASVISVQLGIPYLTGVLNFLASKGALLFISGLVAMALQKRSPSAFLFSLFTACLYVLVEVSGGWRAALFLMPFCVSWFVFALEESAFKSKLKPIFLALAILPPLLFVPVMQYRHMKNRGLGPLEAAQASFSLAKFSKEDFIADIGKIGNRIIGLDWYVIASHATTEHPLGISRVLDPSVGTFFTREVMGVPSESITAYACTYWGFWSMLVGDKWLWTGGVFLGIAVSALSAIFLGRIQSPFVKTVVGCNLTLLFIFFTMANGAIVLYLKEALMLFLGCMAFKWLCGETKPSSITLQESQWPMHRAESPY